MLSYAYDTYKELSPHLCDYTKMIFLSCPPSVCMSRIKYRGRECEQNITLDYLSCLNANYGSVIRNGEHDVIRVNGFQKFELVCDDVCNEIEKLIQYNH